MACKAASIKCPSCPFNRSSARGFTLIELLVAITILAIVAVMGWRGLDSIIRTRTALTQEMDKTRGIQIAFAQLESDCAHAIDPGWFPNHEILRTSNASLLLIRAVYEDEQPVRMQVVSYRVDKEVLIRSESPPTRDLSTLDVFWQSVLNGSDTTIGVNLVKDVTSFSVASFKQPGPLLVYTGIQATLQLKDQNDALTKLFLLGAL